MAKKASRTPAPPLVWTHVNVVYDLDNKLHCGWLTRYENGQAIYTITSASPSAYQCVNDLFTGALRADTDLRDNNLLLPDMGDFQIFYHQQE
jgi:hypothetical protein